jgi:copper resistance protein C
MPRHQMNSPLMHSTPIYWSACAVLLTAILVASAVSVFAHMKAAKMEPAANATVTTPLSRIQVWFTQAPDPKVSKLELVGPGGAVKLTGFQVTKEKSIVANVDGTLGDGRYTARWQAAGDDGHVQKGEFAFTIKRTN